MRFKSSRTEAIKTIKKGRVFFPVYLFKIGSIRCNTQVSTCFQLLHGVRKVFCGNLVLLAGWSQLSESLQLCQILHPSAATSPSGTGSSLWETNLASMGGWFNVATCFLVRNCRNFAAECTGALSCRRKKSRVRYRAGRTRRKREIRQA